MGWGGPGGLQPPLSRAKQLFFEQLLNFPAEASSQKFKKFCLLNEKMKFIPSREMHEVPKSGFFTNKYLLID